MLYHTEKYRHDRKNLPGFHPVRIYSHSLPIIYILTWQTGGMPEMVFEYILKKQNIDPQTDLSIDQSIDFGSTAAAFAEEKGDFTVELYYLLHPQIKRVQIFNL